MTSHLYIWSCKSIATGVTLEEKGLIKFVFLPLKAGISEMPEAAHTELLCNNSRTNWINNIKTLGVGI